MSLSPEISQCNKHSQETTNIEVTYSQKNLHLCIRHFLDSVPETHNNILELITSLIIYYYILQMFTSSSDNINY
jgi:hypothetical protein